jgi:hypothetical protein
MKRLVQRDAEGWIREYANRKVVRIDDLPRPPACSAIAKYALGLKGTFGAGKSTLFNTLISLDSDHCYLTADRAEVKPVGTFLPRYNAAIIGTYLNQCGGCDGFAPRMVQRYLRLLWPYSVHILYEGGIVAGIISTFYELSKQLREEHYREVSFCFLNTPVEECVRRIYVRNGGKPFNEANVAAKNGSIWSAFELYVRKGDVRCSVLNTANSKEKVLDHFFGLYPELVVSRSRQPGDEINRRTA